MAKRKSRWSPMLSDDSTPTADIVKDRSCQPYYGIFADPKTPMFGESLPYTTESVPPDKDPRKGRSLIDAKAYLPLIHYPPARRMLEDGIETATKEEANSATTTDDEPKKDPMSISKAEFDALLPKCEAILAVPLDQRPIRPPRPTQLQNLRFPVPTVITKGVLTIYTKSAATEDLMIDISNRCLSPPSFIIEGGIKRPKTAANVAELPEYPTMAISDARCFVSDEAITADKQLSIQQIETEMALVKRCVHGMRNERWALMKQDYDRAMKAISFYNSTHGTKYEIVETLGSYHHLFYGSHCNFRASESGCDSTPRLFFAELNKVHPGSGLVVKDCKILDDPDQCTDIVHGCQMCSSLIKHPANGYRCGEQN